MLTVRAAALPEQLFLFVLCSGSAGDPGPALSNIASREQSPAGAGLQRRSCLSERCSSEEWSSLTDSSSVTSVCVSCCCQDKRRRGRRRARKMNGGGGTSGVPLEDPARLIFIPDLCGETLAITDRLMQFLPADLLTGTEWGLSSESSSDISISSSLRIPMISSL
ncbi:hypothetical protein F7725_002618 [Dissostichus mawsoni]|uniref:Secreted protein n=1 Tax=Dissostichus mawsoni TaxID=36200 RepID=A0A7J5Y4N6_DISMA|nr:hypothetical protein F7725_002618 [Dissostichus mawsoni]